MVQYGLVPKAAVDRGGGLEFRVDQLPGSAEFSQLYDAYSIDKVEVSFVWYQPFAGAAPGAARAPVMYITRDYDDGNIPTTLGEVLEFGDCKLKAFSLVNNVHTVVVEPRSAVSTYRAGVTSGFTWGSKSAIIDAGSLDVSHYGLRYWTTAHNTTDTPDSQILIVMKYHLSGYASR
jgi:hypothetical protein